MKQVPARALIAASLVFALGGCNSFLGLKLARGAAADAQIRPAAAPDVAENSSPATEIGRNQLKAGLIASAMVSFQEAMTNGEPIAPAANGAGVAFARLGRIDLARRYFEQAIAADPADQRYYDNLARVEREELLLAAAAAMKASPVPVLAKEQHAKRETGPMKRLSRGEVRITTIPANRQTPNVDRARQASVNSGAGQMERLSRGEVRINTVAPMPAPKTFAKLGTHFKPLIRISFADK